MPLYVHSLMGTTLCGRTIINSLKPGVKSGLEALEGGLQGPQGLGETVEQGRTNVVEGLVLESLHPDPGPSQGGDTGHEPPAGAYQGVSSHTTEGNQSLQSLPGVEDFVALYPPLHREKVESLEPLPVGDVLEPPYPFGEGPEGPFLELDVSKQSCWGPQLGGVVLVGLD